MLTRRPIKVAIIVIGVGLLAGAPVHAASKIPIRIPRPDFTPDISPATEPKKPALWHVWETRDGPQLLLQGQCGFAFHHSAIMKAARRGSAEVEYEISLGDDAQSMSDSNHRASPRKLSYRLEDIQFRSFIECGTGFVQKQDLRV